jgi:hypothetical protein
VILQIIILITSAFGVAGLSALHPRRRFWGALIGLCGQPAWFVSTWRAEQWGILLLAVWFSGCYLLAMRGARRT